LPTRSLANEDIDANDARHCGRVVIIKRDDFGYLTICHLKAISNCRLPVASLCLACLF